MSSVRSLFLHSLVCPEEAEGAEARTVPGLGGDSSPAGLTPELLL